MSAQPPACAGADAYLRVAAVSSWCAARGDRAVGGTQPDGHNGTGLPASDRARANSRRRGHGSDLRLADRPLGLIGPGSLTASAHADACRDTQRLPCSFVHCSGRKSHRRIRRASTAWQFARRRAPIVRFCPARLLAALTPAQANLAGDSTFFCLRMGRSGRWPNARAAGRGTQRGRSSLGQWSARAVPSGAGAVVEVGDEGGVAASFHLPAQRRVG